MKTYRFIRPLLFHLAPETAHHWTLLGMRWAYRCGLLRAFAIDCQHPVQAMGLTFPNPLGLAAGLDKDGEAFEAFGALGFGFLELGTVTPRPQPGNPPPRLFRLPEQQALLNRMGFNNAGIEALLARLAQRRYRGVLGINLGKNADTPLEHAAEDYLQGLRKAYAVADYLAINISSPNTRDLRELQQETALEALLGALKAEQILLAQRHGKYTPLAVKIAPDLSDEAIAQIAGLLERYEIDGVIATNTTVARDALPADHPLAKEPGGLSGAPLRERSTHVIRQLARYLPPRVTIIAAGGIMSAADANEKLAAGAKLLQIYTGLIYHGADLLHDLATLFPRRVVEPRQGQKDVE